MKRRGLRLFALLAFLPLASRTFPQDKPERWTEVRSPHFLVATNGKETQARRVADQFELIRAVFEQTLRIRVDPGEPFVILALKDEKTMRVLMPELWARKGLKRLAGCYLPGLDKQYAVVRLDAGGPNPYHVIYHEYAHMVLHLNVRSLPLWANEGLADFYANSAPEGREVGLGRADAAGIQRLRDSSLLPLRDLFQVTSHSPSYTEAAKAPLFYSESWALTHYLILGEKRAAGQRNRMSLFLALLQKDGDEEEAVRQVFGDLENLQRALAGYVRQVTFPYLRVTVQAATAAEDFLARVLTRAETAALLGDFKLHDRRPEDARPLLEEALRLQPGLVAAQESLGLLCFQQGDRAEAGRWFDQAVAGRAPSFIAFYFHAILGLTAGGDDGMERAEADLNRAIRLNPLFADSYVALAGLSMGDDKKLDRALELARKGAELEPGVVANQVMLGNVLVRMGRFDGARELVKPMERAARSPEDKAAVAAFVRYLTSVQELIKR
jgi:tetratricopeptide (TPR) repeat protein